MFLVFSVSSFSQFSQLLVALSSQLISFTRTLGHLVALPSPQYCFGCYPRAFRRTVGQDVCVNAVARHSVSNSQRACSLFRWCSMHSSAPPVTAQGRQIRHCHLHRVLPFLSGPWGVFRRQATTIFSWTGQFTERDPEGGGGTTTLPYVTLIIIGKTNFKSMSEKRQNQPKKMEPPKG